MLCFAFTLFDKVRVGKLSKRNVISFNIFFFSTEPFEAFL